jgi:hypothetical protein
LNWHASVPCYYSNAKIDVHCNSEECRGGVIRNLIKATEQHSDGIFRNNLIHYRAHEVSGLVDDDNNVPVNFPLTLNDFWGLPMNSVNQLLQVYDLDLNGTLTQKRQRLATSTLVWIN